jgi:hypothetical protein
MGGCAAAVAAQQPAPAPPGTTGPVQPPATGTPPQTQPPAQPGTPQPGTPQPDPAQPAEPGAAPQTPPQLGRVVAADAGIIFFPVKLERTADFEKIMAKLHEAIAASPDPVRKEQAAGWRVFKTVEPGPNNTALYVFLIDPAVKGSDYAFWKTMYEAFPAEVQELYRLYTAASAGGQTLLNLQKVLAFSDPPAPPATAPTKPPTEPTKPPTIPPVKNPD